MHAQAVADRLGLRIVVLSTFEESLVIEIHPHGGTRSDRMLHLSFWAEARPLLQQHSPLGHLSRRTLAEPHGPGFQYGVSGPQVHYNSIYGVSDQPPEAPKDKLLGSKRLYNLLAL
jgi:hypothetical protein